MNEGLNFETNLEEERFNEIRKGLLSLRILCSARSAFESPEDAMLLESMSDVLDGLERTFLHHFRARLGHIVSPKSDEPWD
jgi:hypothetical protein